MQEESNSVIKIGARMFEVVKNTQGRKAIFGYVSRHRFATVDTPAIRTSSALLERYIDDSEAHVIIADHFVSRREWELSDSAVSGRESGTLVVLGSHYFVVRASEGGRPVIFKKIIPGTYALLDHGRHGVPRMLSEIADDFGLAPGRSALIFARLLGVSD